MGRWGIVERSLRAWCFLAHFNDLPDPRQRGKVKIAAPGSAAVGPARRLAGR